MPRARQVSRSAAPAPEDGGPSVQPPLKSLEKMLPEIQGLALRVTGRELSVRLGERVRWHRERADVLIEQLAKLGEVERAARDDLDTLLGRLESPRGTLEKAMRAHQERAVYLAFVRDHLKADAVYRLDSADLRMIDLVPISRY